MDMMFINEYAADLTVAVKDMPECFSGGIMP
jgi:hypothetical protein